MNTYVINPSSTWYAVFTVAVVIVLIAAFVWSVRRVAAAVVRLCRVIRRAGRRDDGGGGTPIPRNRGSLRLALLTVAATAGMIGEILNEEPVRLEVGAGRVDMRYRLPWRDRTVDIREIREARLKRRAYARKGATYDHYELVIVRADGATVEAQSFGTPWYDANLVKAHGTIRQLVTARDAEAD